MNNIANMNNPLVSVILASFNENPEYIKSAIESILNQTYQNFELLIFDDSTAKETIDAINSFSDDNRVRIIREDKKMGFVPALNKGLSIAKGELLARMDADDISELNRFEIQVNYLASHPKISIIGGQMDIIDENGNIISHRKYPLNGISLWAFSLLRDPLAHPTVMFRRDIVDCGFRYNEDMKKAEDIDLWLQLLNAGYRIANVPETLLRFRIEKSFNQKRVDDGQRRYVYRARCRNISIKRPVFSVLSVMFSTAFRYAPKRLLVGIYNKENGGKKE